MNGTPQYEYLLTGRDHRGRKVTEIVRAESGDEAVRQFEALGHTEVVLHTDDAAAPLYRPSETASVLSPREQVAIRTLGEGRRFLFHVWKGYRALWHVHLVALAVIGLWFAGQGWGSFALLAAVILMFIPALQFYLAIFGPSAAYLRLLRAIGYAQWERALRLIPKVTLPLSPVELPLLKARALAGLGRLPEALAELDRVTGEPGFRRPVYWLAQAIIYLDAREPERSLEALAQAHELGPDLALVMISYAGRLLTVRRDTRRARELLAEARRHALADSAWPLLFYAEGLLALQEGRAHEAVERLTEAVRRQVPFVRMNPSILASEARMRANLCLALAATGDTAAARAQLLRAAPLLTAHREIDLLKRCEEAVG